MLVRAKKSVLKKKKTRDFTNVAITNYGIKFEVGILGKLARHKWMPSLLIYHLNSNSEVEKGRQINFLKTYVYFSIEATLSWVANLYNSSYQLYFRWFHLSFSFFTLPLLFFFLLVVYSLDTLAIQEDRRKNTQDGH